MSNHHSGLCTVCSTLNLTFKYPPKEVPFEEWLADWEKQRPQYNWRTQDRSWEARWKRRDKRAKAKSEARLRRLLDGGRWTDSGSEDETNYSTSTWSDDRDEDDASDAGDGGNGVSSEGDGDDVDDTDDGGNDDESKGIDGEGHAKEIINGSDSDSDSQSYEDARSCLGGSTDKDGMAERRTARELEVSGSGSGEEESEDDDKDEEEIEHMKKVRAEMDEHRCQMFRRVLEFLGMDPSQYREENRPNSKYAQPYVLKRKTTEGAESEYESDGQLTINNFLQFGPEYALESDKKFERGIHDEMDTHRAELSLKQRWKLGTSQYTALSMVRPAVLALLLEDWRWKGRGENGYGRRVWFSSTRLI
jgi:hypothetical protein